MMDTFLLLKKKGLIPDVATFAMLIKYYGRAGEVDKAVDMAKTMEKSGLKPNNYIYSSLVISLSAAKRTDKAIIILEGMMSEKIIIQQDNATYHVNDNDEEFRRVACESGFDIHMMSQPPNSPD